MKSWNINAVKFRRNCRIVLRSFFSAVTIYTTYRLCNQGFDDSAFWIAGAELLRFGSYQMELFDRKELMENKKSMISQLRYETLEDICEQVDENIQRRRLQSDQEQ